MEEVFVQFESAELKLKRSKCVLFQKSVTYLGHIVSERGIETDPSKVERVCEWPVPENATEVKTYCLLLLHCHIRILQQSLYLTRMPVIMESQLKDGVEHPVAYTSRTLTKAERNYCVTRKELLAVVESVKHFRHYMARSFASELTMHPSARC